MFRPPSPCTVTTSPTTQSKAGADMGKRTSAETLGRNHTEYTEVRRKFTHI